MPENVSNYVKSYFDAFCVELCGKVRRVVLKSSSFFVEKFPTCNSKSKKYCFLLNGFKSCFETARL